jgi:hypothetical protein
VNAETTTSPTNRLRQRISFLRSVVPTTAMRWSFQSACQVLRS